MLRRLGLHEIAGMLTEDHRSGLAQLEALGRCLVGAARGDKQALKVMGLEGANYISLVREHIRQEEILYRLESELQPYAESIT